MPDTVSGTWDPSVNKTNQGPCLHGGDKLTGGRLSPINMINKEIT